MNYDHIGSYYCIDCKNLMGVFVVYSKCKHICIWNLDNNMYLTCKENYLNMLIKITYLNNFLYKLYTYYYLSSKYIYVYI